MRTKTGIALLSACFLALVSCECRRAENTGHEAERHPRTETTNATKHHTPHQHHANATPNLPIIEPLMSMMNRRPHHDDMRRRWRCCNFYFILALVIIVFCAKNVCDAFNSHQNRQHYQTTRRHVSAARKQQPKIAGEGATDEMSFIRMKEAQLVEKLLLDALEKVKKMKRNKNSVLPPSKLFPHVRQCNAALAAFGDSGDFTRALRLFTQMRKAASLFYMIPRERFSPLEHHHHHSLSSINLIPAPPKPTLVTYSTLMSRAISLRKPRVALRLWKLLQTQPNFYTNVISRKRRDGRNANMDSSSYMDPSTLHMLEKEESAIVPDVIFCNTLMNAYAKMGDYRAAKAILNSMLGEKGVPTHEGIPKVKPTAVTYNTLADACKVAGELGPALDVPELMIAQSEATGDKTLLPDLRTYTTLISTVARKSMDKQESRDIRSGGEKDPDMAFALLNRMNHEGIVPNGVTYSALIDVCRRCKRVDMALNGLRLMLKQKAKTNLASKDITTRRLYHHKPLQNEVGAWTAAINACGKAGRTDTAIRLFRTMQKVGVKPSSWTCACISDCLLKSTPIRIKELEEVLQYMKGAGLVPTEVMYTSLMGLALELSQKQSRITKDGLQVQLIDNLSIDSEDTTTEAIFLFKQVMRSLLMQTEKEDMILKVFLVFQEMKNVGILPDVAMYNSLLRACAVTGNIERAQSVLRRMEMDGIVPNRGTLKEAVTLAQNARKTEFAISIWTAMHKKSTQTVPLKPKVSVEMMSDLMKNYASDLQQTSNHDERIIIHREMMNLYQGFTSKLEEFELHDSFEEIASNFTFLLAALKAAVSCEYHSEVNEEKTRSRELACEIVGFEIFQTQQHTDIDRAGIKAIQLATDWLYAFEIS